MLCNQCPRKCNVDRNISNGFCQSPEDIFIAKYMIHHWEEPVISGTDSFGGSGAIFFAGCNLKCVYCQNYEISNSCVGKKVTTLELVELIKELENNGALNINFVTPSHYTEQIIECLKIYKPKVPVVWNSSGYEDIEQIKKLKDYVDIYLVDLKYMDENLSSQLSNAKDYPSIASKVIKQMKINQPKDEFNNGIMKKCVIVRHLVLPNCLDNSFKCLDWIKDNLSTKQFISIMAQYLPCYKAKEIPLINRKLHPIEYKRIVNYVETLSFENGFLQELDSAKCEYTPDFSKFKG